MASIKLIDVYKVYPGDVKAVSDCNIDIEDKEFIVLVGPSGCGKSTVLRMIAGLEEITAGEIYIGDRLVNHVQPKNRDIAMVFQNYALYPHMTVYKNMEFGLKLHKVPKDEIRERVFEAAKMLEIEELLDRKPKALSGGQRQRVALGRAMVRNPAVFLLDEPLSNLDAKLRTAMRAEIINLHKRLETTFVYVTHDQTEAMTMGDRIVVMKDGFIQQIDTPQNLYDYPDNVFVASFIGSPQMNLLDATVVKSDSGYGVRFGECTIHIPASKLVKADLSKYEGKKVKFGIRPEDLDDDADFIEQHKGSVAEAYVEISELMGAEVYLNLSCQGAKMTARVDSKTKSGTGDTIRIAFDENKIQLFDMETELVILH